MSRPSAGFAVLVGSLACACDADKVEWRRFNNPADSVSIEVGPGDPTGPVVVELTSNTGAVVIGTATVDPGRAPVGTDHTLVLEVADDWEERIGRASVTATGDRGVEEYELRQDSADLGFFDLTLTSLGEEGESRTDTWAIALWEPITNPEPDFEEAE